MNKTEINGFDIEIFNQHGLEVGAKSCACPLCSEHRKPKNQKLKVMLLDWDRGLGTCNHCNKTVQLHTFKKPGNRTYSKPKDSVSEVLDAKVVEWFKTDRGISESTLKAAGVTTSPGWIEFNFYAYGELVNRKSRDGKKQFRLEKNCEVVWYNHDALFSNTDIIITEGEIDALSYIESGLLNVISVPNGASNFSYLDDSIDLFDNIDKVYLSMDSDEAGDKLKAELIRRLGAEKCLMVALPQSNDANEFLVAHGVDALKEQIRHASPVPLDNVKTIDDFYEDFEEFVRDGAKPGFQIGLPEFDSVFSTYTSQFIVVTGIPGHGKSDWIDMMTMGYNHKYGWKVAYASPENKPDHIHAHKIWRKYWNGFPTKEDINTERWNKTKQHLAENFYFIDMDTFDLDEVLKKGSELVKRKGIRCLVIDPFNKVRMKGASAMSIPDATMEYLGKIDAWVKKHDCLCIIAAHPVKMQKKDNGEYEEPTFYSIKGGGEWFDMSYHGLSIYRDYGAKSTKVKVIKCKFQNLGENGAETHFTWDKKSGRFLESVGQQQEDSGLPW